MAKQQLNEEKISKLISFILGAVVGGKTNSVTSKVSNDKELVKSIKDLDDSYQNLLKHFEKKYGKDFVDKVKTKTSKLNL